MCNYTEDFQLLFLIHLFILASTIRHQAAFRCLPVRLYFAHNHNFVIRFIGHNLFRPSSIGHYLEKVAHAIMCFRLGVVYFFRNISLLLGPRYLLGVCNLIKKNLQAQHAVQFNWMFECSRQLSSLGVPPIPKGFPL